MIPPTINLDEPADGCDLNFVTGLGARGRAAYRACARARLTADSTARWSASRELTGRLGWTWSSSPSTLASFEGVLVPASALEGVPLFEGLSADELVDRGHGDALDFSPGAVICREGEPGKEHAGWWSRGWHTQLVALPEEPELRSRSVFAEAADGSCGRAM